MRHSVPTRTTLLVRVRDLQDAQAWTEFVDLYAPIVYRYCRKHGLQDADAEDLTQDVLRSVAGAVGRLNYDRKRGSFRGWLLTVARNKLSNFLNRQRRRPRASGDDDVKELLDQQPAREDPDAEFWDREYEQRLFQWAADRVRGGFQESTWKAFWGTVVDGHAPAEVARSLGISVGAVYIAKSRVLAQLKKQIEQIGDV